MPVRTERVDKWGRGDVDDVAGVGSREPLLFGGGRFPVPGYASPRDQWRTDLLSESGDAPPRQPFFFLPQGPVAGWFDLTVGDRTIPHAAWARDAPELRDLL